ncbi:hypothetical protein [Streptomyces sp. NPDC001889]
MPILFGLGVPPGEAVEGHLRDLLDGVALLFGRLDELREQVLDAQLRDLLDARIDDRLDGFLTGAAGRAARHQSGRCLGGVARGLGHDRLIDVPGDAAVAVTEGLGHDLDVHAGGQHE